MRRIAALVASMLGFSCSARIPAGNVVTVTVDEDVPILVELDWQTPWPSRTRVHFGVDGALERTIEVNDAASVDHHAVLLDLPPETVVDYEIEVVDGGLGEGVPWRMAGHFKTGALPPTLPNFVLEGDGEADQSGRYLMGGTILNDPHLFVVGRDGRWVWWEEGSDLMWAFQMEPNLGSTALASSRFSKNHGEDIGAILIRDWAGNEIEEKPLSLGHHVFYQLADGTIAYPSLDVRPWKDPETGETQDVVGDRLMELSPDGSVREVFNTWDWVVIEDNWSGDILEFYPQGGDWTHANAVDYDPEREVYLFCLEKLEVLVEIDRNTGEPVRWIRSSQTEFFGDAPILDPSKSTPGLGSPHDANYTSDGTLIMLSTEDETRVVELEMNDDQGVFSEIWSFGDGRNEKAIALGMARRLDEGTVYYNGGYLGFVREVTNEGEILWELTLDSGRFGQAQLLDDLGNGEVWE